MCVSRQVAQRGWHIPIAGLILFLFLLLILFLFLPVLRAVQSSDRTRRTVRCGCDPHYRRANLSMGSGRWPKR